MKTMQFLYKVIRGTDTEVHGLTTGVALYLFGQPPLELDGSAVLDTLDLSTSWFKLPAFAPFAFPPPQEVTLTAARSVEASATGSDRVRVDASRGKERVKLSAGSPFLRCRLALLGWNLPFSLPSGKE